MRVALCLKGRVGGNGRHSGDDKIIAERSFNQFRKNLLDVNKNVDVFIHSWSTDYEEYLTNCYKPKKNI